MTTKDQERASLAKIRKIVEGLGEESYIGRAFEGCFEMAESNINNDFWDSMKSTIEMKEDAIRSLNKQLEDQATAKGAEVKSLLKQVEEYKEDCNALNERIEKLRKDKFAAEKQATEEIKEIHLELNNGESYNGRFAELRYVDRNGFRFVTVIEDTGWATSYKLDDIKALSIN